MLRSQPEAIQMLAEDIGVHMRVLPRRAPGTIVLAAILASPLELVAQRVRDEVVELSNGDRVTGEIKGLDRSQLTVRTIDLGTVQIRWQRVVRLNSNRTLEIELADGRRLQGSLVSPTPGTLDVSGSAGTVHVDLASIVVIRPVARSWIGDLTGRIDAGFSYTRGSQRRPDFGQCRDHHPAPCLRVDPHVQRGADHGGGAVG